VYFIKSVSHVEVLLKSNAFVLSDCSVQSLVVRGLKCCDLYKFHPDAHVLTLIIVISSDTEKM